MNAQEVHTFDLIVDHPVSDEQLDALFDAGCDDCSPEISSTDTVLHFDREAPSLISAIVSAVLAVEQSGLTVAGAGSPDLVTQSEIAVRTRRSPESIRLLAAGRRGPGSFPRARSAFYSWPEVRAWFAQYDPSAVGDPSDDDLAYDKLIAAANILIRARTVLRTADTPGLEALLRAA